MLYLVRHGQTDWNKIHKLQGTTDIPLNDTGRQMAEDARPLLDELQLDACYCSPLIRAAETAQILLRGKEIPVYFDDRLKELCFGRFEGTTDYYSNPENPIYPLFHDPEHYVAGEDEESFEVLNARVKSFLEEVAAPYCKQGKNILVVGHGAVSLSFYNQLYDIPLSKFWDALMKNCEVRGIEDEVVLRFCR